MKKYGEKHSEGDRDRERVCKLCEAIVMRGEVAKDNSNRKFHYKQPARA